jgi:cell division protein FtsL
LHEEKSVIGRKKQASKKGSWRKSLRITSRTVFIMVSLLIVGGLYLAVNSRVARLGRQVLDRQNEKAELERQTAELHSVLAELTMPDKMMERALELGFRPAEMGDIQYIVVEGYLDPDPFVAPAPPESFIEHTGSLSPAYTETLGDWVSRLVKPRTGTTR